METAEGNARLRESRKRGSNGFPQRSESQCVMKLCENSLRVGGCNDLSSPALSFRYRKFPHPYSLPTLLASADFDGAYAVMFLCPPQRPFVEAFGSGEPENCSSGKWGSAERGFEPASYVKDFTGAAFLSSPLRVAGREKALRSPLLFGFGFALSRFEFTLAEWKHNLRHIAP